MPPFPNFNGIGSFDPASDPLFGQLVNPVLTTLAKQFRPTGFAYDRLTSSFPVLTQAGQYPVFDPEYFFALEDGTSIADDAPTPEINFKLSLEPYQAADYRRMIRLTRKELLQARALGDPAKLEWSKTALLMTRMALLREARLAARLRSQVNGGQFTAPTFTPAAKWDSSPGAAGATIKQDLDFCAQVVYRQCGMRPNTLAVTREIAAAISSDFVVRDTIKYSGGAAYLSQGTNSLPPTLYGYNVVEIDGVLGNVAQEGQPMTLGEIWGNSARLLYVNPNPAWGLPSTVYSFRAPVTGSVGSISPSPVLLPDTTGGEPDPMGSSVVVERWAQFDPPSGLIRAWECVDERVVAKELGIELANVISDTQNPY